MHSSDQPKGWGGGGQSREVSTVVIRWKEGGPSRPPAAIKDSGGQATPPSPLSSCADLYGGANSLTLQAEEGAGESEGGGDPPGWMGRGVGGGGGSRTERLHPKSQINLRDFCFGELWLASRVFGASTGLLLTGNRRHHGMCGGGGWEGGRRGAGGMGAGDTLAARGCQRFLQTK